MSKITNLADSRKTCGTSFYGDTIYASADEICDKLGVEISCYDGDKTHFEFELELEDGTPFTLYDWKEGWAFEDTKLYYHIGAKTEEDSSRVLSALREYGFRGAAEIDLSKQFDAVAEMQKMLGF